MSEFKGVHYKVTLKHKNCGNKFRALTTNFLYGKHTRCPYCWNCIKKIDTNSYLSKMNNHHLLNKYKLLSKVNGISSRISIKHLKCGNRFKIRAGTLLKDVGDSNNHCPFCIDHTLTTKQVKQRIKNKYGCSILLLGDYKGMEEPITLRHNECGYIWKSRKATYFLNYNHGCPRCSQEKQIKINRISAKKHFVSSALGERFILKRPYYNNNIKVKIYDKKCGHSFWKRPSNFKDDSYKCPYCSAPYNERLIMRFLEDHNIRYKYARLLNNSKKYQKRLHLNFWIPDVYLFDNDKTYNNGIGIEYDGRQHFDPYAFYTKAYSLPEHLSKFNRLRVNDKRTNKYCDKHNIYLIRISYNESTVKASKNKINKAFKTEVIR